MAKYLIKHWINADFIVEKLVEESEIDIVKSDLKQYKTPDRTFNYVMIKGSEKINRTTYEKYDESLNDSTKKPTSD